MDERVAGHCSSWAVMWSRSKTHPLGPGWLRRASHVFFISVSEIGLKILEISTLIFVLLYRCYATTQVMFSLCQRYVHSIHEEGVVISWSIMEHVSGILDGLTRQSGRAHSQYGHIQSCYSGTLGERTGRSADSRGAIHSVWTDTMGLASYAPPRDTTGWKRKKHKKITQHPGSQTTGTTSQPAVRQWQHWQHRVAAEILSEPL